MRRTDATPASARSAFKLERAGGVRRSIDAPHRTRGEQLDGNRPRIHRTLVPDHVYMVAPLVDERHPDRVDLGSAGGIIAFIGGNGSSSDSDQAVAWVRVPPGSAAGDPQVALDVEVGIPLGFLRRVPHVLFRIRG